jgi:hypothetical protein
MEELEEKQEEIESPEEYYKNQAFRMWLHTSRSSMFLKTIELKLK